MPRFSEDAGHTNNNGLLLLDFCKQTGLRIMNGTVGNEGGGGSGDTLLSEAGEAAW